MIPKPFRKRSEKSREGTNRDYRLMMKDGFRGEVGTIEMN
jgi:hypothetical protein